MSVLQIKVLTISVPLLINWFWLTKLKENVSSSSSNIKAIPKGGFHMEPPGFAPGMHICMHVCVCGIMSVVVCGVYVCSVVLRVCIVVCVLCHVRACVHASVLVSCV